MIETKLDPKEELEYAQLRRMGQRLHIPIHEVFIKLEVFDRDGKLIQRHHQRSHSWTRNAYNMMFSQLAGAPPSDVTFEAGKLSQKATSGTIYSGLYPFGMFLSKSVAPYSYEYNTVLGYRAPASNVNYGILVGSSTDASSFEDYVLITPIIEGTGAGQLSYTESALNSISYAALALKNELIRYINNNTALLTDVDVNEVAIVCKSGSVQTPSTSVYTLMARDHLVSTVTVPSTGQLKVTYTIQLTYPV